MKKQIFTLLIFFLAILPSINAQGIGIGTSSPDASVILDISSINQGLLLPRMKTSQRTIIEFPANGLLVFDTNTKSMWCFSNSM